MTTASLPTTTKMFRSYALLRSMQSATPKVRRVRTVGRFDAVEARGGGEIQMEATAAGLRELGVDCRPWRPWEDSLCDDTVVHFFGSRAEFVPLAIAARRAGAKVAVSTIAWFDWRNIWREADSTAYRAWATLRYAARCVRPQLPSWRRTLYQTADVLLPNSKAEAEQLTRLFRVPAERITVVPNGAESRFADADPQLFIAEYGFRDFLLSVGRLEPRKNQMQLIRAARDLRLPLVVIGNAEPKHRAYADACRKSAGREVLFLDRLGHDDPLLASAYAASACTALVGWYETPGLAALEAGMTGTPLVLPEGGCAREYFGELAEYVPHNNLGALTAALSRSLERGRSRELATLVLEHFTWRRAADATWEAYANAR